MQALERRFYGDPERILLAIEAKSCAGCSRIQHAFGRDYCGAGHDFGRRCKNYDEVVVKNG